MLQEKYSKIIVDFLKSHPAISIQIVEKKLNLPATTIAKALPSARLIPAKHIYPILCFLADYGIKIDGYDISYDPSDNTLFFRKWVENIETVEEDGGFVYIIKEYRHFAAGYFDLL